MSRRIVRTIVKVAVLSLVLAFAIFLLDSHFRVLPEQIHTQLQHPHTGSVVTDINIQECINPVRACAAVEKDSWTRVEKDVYLTGKWVKKAYVTFQRKKEVEFAASAGDRIVVDVRFSLKKPAAKDGAGGVAEWEQRPGNMWIKRQSKLQSDIAITAVEVLFGPDAVEVRPGWQLKEGSLDFGTWSPRLTVRRGPNIEVTKPIVQMSAKYRLKVIQVSGMPTQ